MRRLSLEGRLWADFGNLDCTFSADDCFYEDRQKHEKIKGRLKRLLGLNSSDSILGR